jgi:hypothetical protein
MESCSVTLLGMLFYLKEELPILVCKIKQMLCSGKYFVVEVIQLYLFMKLNGFHYDA